MKKDWIECIAVTVHNTACLSDELIAQIADKLVELQNTEDNTLLCCANSLQTPTVGLRICLMPFSKGY